jgi:Mn2+/Fe2+ NRAMP family transporter
MSFVGAVSLCALTLAGGVASVRDFARNVPERRASLASCFAIILFIMVILCTGIFVYLRFAGPWY